MKRYILRILAVMAIALVAVAAQAANPIRWRASVKMTSANAGVITLKALVDEGWHVYGLEMPEDGPRATQFDFSESTGIKLTGKPKASRKPVVSHDEMFGLDLTWWAENVEFTIPFKVTGKSPYVRGKITFMGCNDSNCMPPTTESVALPVPPFKKKK